MLASLLLLASSALAGPRIENAVHLHTATRDYLEFDISPWSGCTAPVGLRVVPAGAHTAKVYWEASGIVADTLCPVSPTRVNVVLPFPDSVGGSHGAFLVDTVIDANHNVVLTKVGRVQNPMRHFVCPMIACLEEDSATAFQKVRARVQSSSFLATLAPYSVATFVAVSPWSLTTGLESFPEVAVPLPGNLGNWMGEEVRQLAMDSLISGGLMMICAQTPDTVCPQYVFMPMVQIPTGPVQYYYQQGSDPFRGDTGQAGPFRVDTVLKVGSGLHLSGFVNHDCGTPMVDSQLIQTSRWLVASNGSTADSLASAFRLPPLCATARLGAWPLENGRVEIKPNVWVPLADLLAMDAILPRSTKLDGPTLRRVGQAVSLELPISARVRAIDLAGREILPQTDFAKGSHFLSLPGHTMIFVQARSGMSMVTLPLDPVR